MNGVDIAVVIIVSLLVLLVISLRFILPKFLSHKLKKSNKEKENSCANCQRH